MQAAFYQACKNGDVETVKCLLDDSRVDPTSNDGPTFPIVCASAYGHAEIVKLLLADPRVDPVIDDNRAICLAVIGECVDVVKLLLADCRVNPKGGNGARFKYYNSFIDVVIFDDVSCYIVNEDTTPIEDDNIREKYIEWLYRIGGEKHSKASNSFMENLK